MFTAITHSYKKHAAFSFVLASVLALTACGGGGGGGTKTLKTTVQVDSPIAGSAVDNTSTDFQVTLLTGTTTGLTITLNSVDVTALFTGSPRTASVYALSGLLKEGTNYFNAKTSGSKTSGVEFTYHAKPEAVMTTLSSCSAGVCTVKGETHRATVTSLLLDGSSIGSSIMPASSAVGSDFLIANKIIPTVDSTQKTAADFILTLTGANASETTKYILPKSVVKYGAAVQVNNTALSESSVLSKWFTTVLKANIAPALNTVKATGLWNTPIASSADLTEANVNTTVRDAKVLLHDANNACLILKSGGINGTVNDCYVLASDIDFSQGTSDTTEIKVVDDADGNQVGIDIKVKLSKLTITFDSLGYFSGVFKGAQQAAVSFTATFTFHLIAYRDNDIIIGFKVVDTDTTLNELYPGALGVDLSSPVKVVGKEFCTTTLCVSPLDVQVFGTAAPLIADQVVEKAQAQIGSINTKLSTSTLNNTRLFKFVEQAVDSKVAAVTMQRIIPNSVDFPSQYAIQITDNNVADLTEGMKVTFLDVPAGSAIKSNKTYYVKALMGNTYLISLNASDAALNGSGFAVDVDANDLVLTSSLVKRKVVIVKPQSLINFDFLSSVLNEAKSSGTAKGLFLGIAGSTFASGDYPAETYLDAYPDKPVDPIDNIIKMPFNWPQTYQSYASLPALQEPIPTLGSYFKPLTPNGAVDKNFFNATDDITLALSENSLNQLLLAAYQSKLLTYQDQAMVVGDLGDLGAQIISLTSGTAFTVVAGDLVTMSFDLQAVPHAAFDAAGVEIILNKLKVQLKLYRACSGNTVATCTALYTSDFTLDAKMLATFGLNGLVPNLPLASIDDIAITVVGDVVNTFLTPLASNATNDIINNYVRSSVDGQLNAGTLSVIMPAFISDLVGDQITAMTQPIVQNLDLKNVGLDNQSAELRLQTLMVDTTKEFIQVSAKLVEVLPSDAVGGIVRLNLTDSCVANPVSTGCSH